MASEQKIFNFLKAVYQCSSSSGLVPICWQGQCSGAMRVFDLYTWEPVQNKRWTGLIICNLDENTNQYTSSPCHIYPTELDRMVSPLNFYRVAFKGFGSEFFPPAYGCGASGNAKGSHRSNRCSCIHRRSTPTCHKPRRRTRVSRAILSSRARGAKFAPQKKTLFGR